jgi:aminoglycoside phosphotransferase (APT) family kinase protein
MPAEEDVVSAPRWSPERPCPVERATALVAAAFPALRGQPVGLLAQGWDNTVHLVGGTWVFRFPRREVALAGFRRELAVLPQLAPLVPLPVPVPELVGVDDDAADPWPFAGARLLPGRELADSGLADSDRTAAARTVGGFLRALHDVRTRCAVTLELPVDPMRRSEPRARMDDTRQQLRQLVADGIWPGDPAVDALLSSAGRLGPPAGDPVLVHGDLHVRHLLVDEAGEATAVIDWGDVCLADPAVDLALAYTAFTGPSRAALLRAYGGVDAERQLRARALGVRLSGFLAAYAAAERRPSLLAEALAGLRRAVG